MWAWPASPPLSTHLFLHTHHITSCTTTIAGIDLPSSSFSFSICLSFSHVRTKPSELDSFYVHLAMANHAVFRSSLVCLALVVVLVGICTQSFRKMMVTYLLGVIGIGGVLLPDWPYFDRDFSRWGAPVTVEERAFANASAERSGLARFKRYPMRLAAYATIYGFAGYKWWSFVSS